MRRIPNRLLSLALSAGLVLVILSAVVAFGLMANAGAPEVTDGPGSEPPRVETHEVRWEDGYTIERSFVGRVEARRSTDLGFEIGGMVLEVLVEEGRTVKRGEPIARLDTKLKQARRAELIAARDQAQANFELAETTRQRTLRTASRGSATQQEIDNVEQAYRAANAALQQSRSAVSTIDVEIDKATITSPYDAVVSERRVDEGRVITQGTPVVRLLEKRDPEVRVGISGALVEKVSVGQRLDAMIGSRVVGGAVRSVLPTREEQARGVDVLIRLDAELNGIRQGDLARVSIPREIAAEGFWVPTQSLTQGVRGLWSIYQIEGDDASTAATLSRVDVEVLHTQGDSTYVRGPIKGGAQIVSTGLHRIAPGMAVRAQAVGDPEPLPGAAR